MFETSAIKPTFVAFSCLNTYLNVQTSSFARLSHVKIKRMKNIFGEGRGQEESMLNKTGKGISKNKRKKVTSKHDLEDHAHKTDDSGIEENAFQLDSLGIHIGEKSAL